MRPGQNQVSISDWLLKIYYCILGKHIVKEDCFKSFVHKVTLYDPVSEKTPLSVNAQSNSL